MASRKQIPLNLAYALSIHKSQGMTIDHLEIFLNTAFEFGMAYVALSRATSLKTLTLSSFNPKVIRANPKALQFYQQMKCFDL